MKSCNPGILFAFACYGLWGVLPIYWKLLQAVPAGQILAHRMIWSLVAVLIILWRRGDWSWLSPVRKAPLSFIKQLLPPAALITGNWFLYIWSVNNGYIVETSLGYFINPLINVMLAMVLLNEKLRRYQWLAVLIAAAGVAYLTFVYGQLPWISLVLASSFAFYGLLKRKSPLGALQGLSIETALFVIFAIAYLIVEEINGTGHFGHMGLKTDLLLIGAGLATSLPLIWFAAAAKRLSFTTLGLTQFIAPTLQFLIGVLIYKEAFSNDQLIGFSLIWLALTLFTIEGFLSVKNRNKI